jgi:hypothetical protein
VCTRDAERLCEPARPGREEADVVESTAASHHVETRRRLDRTEQHGLAEPL